jgi:hypothetical protein
MPLQQLAPNRKKRFQENFDSKNFMIVAPIKIHAIDCCKFPIGFQTSIKIKKFTRLFFS